MPRHSLATLFFLLLICGTVDAKTASEMLGKAYMDCRLLLSSHQRLACYDNLVEQDQVVTFIAANPEQIAVNHEQRAQKPGFLTSDDPNYFVYASPMSDDLDDEAHIEFYLSLKYPLVENFFQQRKYNVDSDGKPGATRHWMPDRLYAVYNGLFDFYALDSERYTSSPVISRRQNPGLTLEWDLGNPRDKLRVGWFHESNGQTLDRDRSLPAGQPDSSLEELLEDFQDRGKDFGLARVSRGWDYASFRFERRKHHRLVEDQDDSWYRVQAEYRLFCNCQGLTEDREDSIWWDQGNNSRIEDYDGLRLMGERAIGFGSTHLLTRLEYKSGVRDIDALGNSSWKLSLGYKLGNTRWTAFYFNGYGKEPSTYHLRTEYWGLGLELR